MLPSILPPKKSFSRPIRRSKLSPQRLSLETLPFVGVIDCENIGNRNGVYVPRLTRRLIFLGNVFGKRLYRRVWRIPFNRARKASCGDMLSSVLDDPDRRGDDLPSLAPGWSLPEPGPLACTRHCLRISSILASVVKCLPAIISTVSRLRLISRRRPASVIPPLGKAILSASARRSGSAGVVCCRAPLGYALTGPGVCSVGARPHLG